MSYITNGENIDRVLDEVNKKMEDLKIDHKSQVATRLGIDIVLMAYKDKFGEIPFDIEYFKRIGGNKIKLSFDCEAYNPFEAQDDYNDFMGAIERQTGSMALWSYKNGKNILIFSPKKTDKGWVNLLIALVAAVILGFAARALPQNVVEVLRDGIFTPILDTFLGFLNAIAGPMIFLSIVWGISSIGNRHTFATLSSKLFGFMMIGLVVSVGIVAAISAGVFNLNFGNTQTSSNYSSLFRMVLDIVPNNLFTPFSRGNTLQILFLGIVVGVTMIMLGERTSNISIITDQLGEIVQYIMIAIGKLIPIFIFGSLFNIIISNQFESLSVSYVFFLSTIGACTLIIMLHIAFTSVYTKLSISSILKNTLPSFIIALTTASSAAAFASNVDAAIYKYKVKSKYANFCVPFAQVLYKPGLAVTYFMATISTALSCGMEITVTWIIIDCILCFILSCATPTVPGGSTASFTILFTQLGLPMDGLAAVIALNLILDFYHTATNIFSDHCLTVSSAKKLEQLEE